MQEEQKKILIRAFSTRKCTSCTKENIVKSLIDMNMPTRSKKVPIDFKKKKKKDYVG